MPSPEGCPKTARILMCVSVALTCTICVLRGVCIVMCFSNVCVVYCDVCVLVYRSTAVGTQFSSWEAMLKDTEEEAKVMKY